MINLDYSPYKSIEAFLHECGSYSFFPSIMDIQTQADVDELRDELALLKGDYEDGVSPLEETPIDVDFEIKQNKLHRLYPDQHKPSRLGSKVELDAC